MRDSIDSKSMKMDAADMKKDNHMHMHLDINDSLKNVKKDMWNIDMDTTKTLKQLHHENDSIKKMKNRMIEKQ